MSDTKMQSSLMAILAVCAVFVALISFFLPFVSISFFGTYSYSALELIEEIIDYPEFPDVGVLISLVCTVLGIVFSLLALKKRGMEVGTIITSAVGMILMIAAMTSDIGLGQSAIDYAAIGFYLYEIASLAAIVLSVSAGYISKHAEPTPKPVPSASEPTPTKKTVCPKCKAKNEKDAAFCRFCGTSLGEEEPKLLTVSEIVRRYEKMGETISVEQVVIGPTPAGGAYAIQRKSDTWIEITEYDTNDNPVNRTYGSIGKKSTVDRKNRKEICPRCGARHMAGTANCKYCGTAITGTNSPKTDPAPKTKDGKVMCPHCGARHMAGTTNCKYCGTSMH